MDCAERIWTDRSLSPPLLVYCEEIIFQLLDAIGYAGRSVSAGRASVYFAVKSCYRPAVLRCLAALGVGAEVMSWNEFQLARTAGFPDSRILCNGLGRSPELLDAAYRAGARIVIDSLTDLQRVEELLDKGLGPARLGLRLKPDMSAFPGTAYASDRHKLGLREGSQEFAAVLERCTSNPLLRLDLLHVHAASNQTDAELFVHLLDELAGSLRRIESTYPAIRIQSVDLGGGFAAFDVENLSAARDLFGRIARHFNQLFGDRELIIEPGRYLIDSAAFVLATVQAVKQDAGRCYMVTDASTNTLMPFKEATYRLVHPQPDPEGRHRVAVVDGITSLTSIVIPEVRLQHLPAVGERVLLANCGAYTSALSKFWVYDPLPVAFLDRSGRMEIDLHLDQIREARRLILGI
jgi:diaminopimelate decarboxylase